MSCATWHVPKKHQERINCSLVLIDIVVTNVCSTVTDIPMSTAHKSAFLGLFFGRERQMHTIDKMSMRFCSSPTKESVKSWHKQLRLLFFSWNGTALEYGKKSMKKLRSYSLKLKDGNWRPLSDLYSSLHSGLRILALSNRGSDGEFGEVFSRNVVPKLFFPSPFDEQCPLSV
jgi:hypothetical protein